MASTLILVRHAQTALSGTFCGSTDPPLNERGQAQLPGLSERLSQFSFDRIYCSDLLRAQQTAAAVAAPRAIPIEVRQGLRQIHFGAWETLTWQEIEQADAAFAVRWVAEFPNVTPPGGEPIAQFRLRVLEEFALIRQQACGQTVAVITHSTVLRVLLEELGHLSPHHAWELTREYTCTIRTSQNSPNGPLTIDALQKTVLPAALSV
jgi:alpha-ribazole phosphatase/probable phosphoglycerate mutase